MIPFHSALTTQRPFSRLQPRCGSGRRLANITISIAITLLRPSLTTSSLSTTSRGHRQTRKRVPSGSQLTALRKHYQQQLSSPTTMLSRGAVATKTCIVRSKQLQPTPRLSFVCVSRGAVCNCIPKNPFNDKPPSLPPRLQLPPVWTAYCPHCPISPSHQPRSRWFN